MFLLLQGSFQKCVQRCIFHEHEMNIHWGERHCALVYLFATTHYLGGVCTKMCMCRLKNYPDHAGIGWHEFKVGKTEQNRI